MSLPDRHRKNLRRRALNGLSWDSEDLRKGFADADGVLLIEGFPTESNTAFIKLARQFGDITQPGQLIDHPLEDGHVYNVECKADGLRMPNGYVVHSTSPAMFSCHTDGFGGVRVPSTVFLLCVRPDPNGGETLISFVDDIQQYLSESDVNLLLSPVYPNGMERIPLLHITSSGRIGARFNLADLTFYSERADLPLEKDYLDVAVRFGAIADDLALKTKFALRSGDCLIIDNTFVLHGRTAVPFGSQRLLKRLRTYG